MRACSWAIFLVGVVGFTSCSPRETDFDPELSERLTLDAGSSLHVDVAASIDRVSIFVKRNSRDDFLGPDPGALPIIELSADDDVRRFLAAVGEMVQLGSWETEGCDERLDRDVYHVLAADVARNRTAYFLMRGCLAETGLRYAIIRPLQKTTSSIYFSRAAVRWLRRAEAASRK
jgi:hypothetical protein